MTTRPSASTNVRVAAWLFAIPMNLVALSTLVVALTAKDAPHPEVALTLAVILVAGVGIISIRWIQMSVYIRNGELVVRNLASTYRLPVAEVERVSMGDMAALGARTGFAVLVDGSTTKISALSSGTILSSAPSARTLNIVEALNTAIAESRSR